MDHSTGEASLVHTAPQGKPGTAAARAAAAGRRSSWRAVTVEARRTAGHAAWGMMR